MPSLVRGVVLTYRGPLVERFHPEIVDEDGNPTGEYDMSEIEESTDETRAIVVMVGDDHRYTVDTEDMRPFNGIPCSCGQVGCCEEITDDSE